MSPPQGVDFCVSTTFVTHGANNFAENDSGGINGSGLNDYPQVTSQGNNVGYSANAGSGVSGRDRSPAIDARIASFHGPTVGSGSLDYKIDLTNMGGPGTYDIWVGAGDNSYAATCKVEVFEGDATTSRGVLFNGSTGAAGKFFDALGNIWTAAQWPSNGSEDQNTNKATKTFTSTAIIFRIGDGAGNGVINHLFVKSVPAVLPYPYQRRGNPFIRTR